MKYFIVLSFFVFFIFLVTNCSPSSSSGEALYLQHCGNCHMASGEGLGELIPDLRNIEDFSNRHEELICLIKNGAKALNEQDNISEGYSMPPNPQLSEIEITNILNFIRSKWHEQSKNFSLPEVQKNLANCN